MSPENTQARVLRILTAQVNCFDDSPTEIKLDDRIEADLGFDSLDCIETLIALEEEFSIVLDDEKFDALKTVQQVVDFIADVCTAGQAGEAA